MNGKVIVFGAGISGLTAAQGLAERDFDVSVYESSRGMGPGGDDDMRLGGMARSQYTKANRIHQFRPDSPPPPGGVLAGEHGFRFFPSYYHNVWDTLQTIPLYEGDVPTGRTVFDNLVPDVGEAYVRKGSKPFMMARSRPRSLSEIIVEIQNLIEARGTPQDLQTYTARLVRYFSTCSERRDAECEDISYLAYLEGRNSPEKRTPVHYSKPFLDVMARSPRVLAALNASYGDARTNMDAAAQLVMNLLMYLPKVDGVLNAPTTEAWFIPWRYHLEKLGVTFTEGRLDRLALSNNGALEAWVKPRKGRAKKVDADYFIVATDAVNAERVTRKLPAIGVPAGLRGYATSVPPNPFTGEGSIEDRDPETEPGKTPWDRFQTCTGIQFFFREPLELVHGHVYVGGSPWALTAIAEQAFWTRPPTLEQDGYQSVISVDICEWNAPGLDGHPPARECTRHEIAHEVWRQMTDALPHEGDYPEPAWYTMDQNILFAPAAGEAPGKPSLTGHGLPVKNLTPYLVPIAGDWDRRPGAEPWNPGDGSVAESFEPMDEALWQAGHGGYLIHWNKLVFAGVYKKTFTRLTTMEAACESGRHAVNAILDHAIHEKSGRTDPRSEPGQIWSIPQSLSTRRTGYPVRRPSPLGDYCNVWNIEQHEIPDFEFAKQIDRWLFERGLPHLWESTGLDQLVSVSSKLGGSIPSWSPESWMEMLERITEGYDGASANDVGEKLLQLMRRIREMLEAAGRTYGEDRA